MKLSTKGRYGLRAMVDIAVYSQDSPVPISAIAERQNISVSYLEQLLPKLKKADRKSTRLNSSHPLSSRMPSSA